MSRRNNNNESLRAILEANNRKLQMGGLSDREIQESTVASSILLSEVCNQLEALNTRLDNALGINRESDDGD